MLPLSCHRKKLQNLSHLYYVVQIRQIWIQLVKVCGKYCKRCCTKHASLSWSCQRRHRCQPQWRHSTVCSQSLFQFVQTSDAYFVHLLLQYSHTLYSIGFKSAKFGDIVEVKLIIGVSSCNNPMVARVRLTFQVSQGGVETLFWWGGKHLYHFAAFFSGNGVPNFIRIAGAL